MLRSSCVHFKGYEDGENYCEAYNVACLYNCPNECKDYAPCEGRCGGCPVLMCENKPTSAIEKAGYCAIERAEAREW